MKEQIMVLIFQSNMKKQTNIDDLLVHVDINTLDICEKRMYEHHIKHSTKMEALMIIINDVNGDPSQLSSQLSEIAELIIEL